MGFGGKGCLSTTIWTKTGDALHRPVIFFHLSSFCGATKSLTNRFASSSQFSFASGDASLNCFRVSGEGQKTNGFFFCSCFIRFHPPVSPSPQLLRCPRGP